MGFIRDWAQQAAGAPPAGYETHVLYPWASIVHNIDPGTGGEGGTPAAYTDYDNFFDLDDSGMFNVMTELYALRRDGDGSVYDGLAAYNPDDHITRLEQALDRFQNEIDGYDVASDLPQAIEIAREQAAVLMDDDSIDDAVDAFEARQRTDHLEAVSSTLMGLWDAGAILSTQALQAVAILEDGRQRTVAEYSAKLRLGREDQRIQSATQFATVILQRRDREVALRQAYIGAALDSLRYTVTVKQDQQDKDVEYLIADKFWDLSLLQQALNANSAIYGAQIVPRAQTKGERLMAALNGAASMGIQGGMATGSPEGGVALGGMSLLSGLLL
jgi:hypothetical protein